MQIILGITGGIAAYKSAELARLLANQGHRVRCILTEAGSRFITPLTLTSLTGEPCYGANPDQGEWRANPSVEHIELARWAAALRRGVTFHLVSHMDEVLELALTPVQPPTPEMPSVPAPAPAAGSTQAPAATRRRPPIRPAVFPHC